MPDNDNLSGQRLTAREIVRGGAVEIPSQTRSLVDLLNRRSPQNMSNQPLVQRVATTLFSSPHNGLTRSSLQLDAARLT